MQTRSGKAGGRRPDRTGDLVPPRLCAWCQVPRSGRLPARLALHFIGNWPNRLSQGRGTASLLQVFISSFSTMNKFIRGKYMRTLWLWSLLRVLQVFRLINVSREKPIARFG